MATARDVRHLRDVSAESASPYESRRLRILMPCPHPGIRGPIPGHTPHLVGALRSFGCDVRTECWGRHRDNEGIAGRVLGRARDVMIVRRRLAREEFDVLVVKTSFVWAGLCRDLALLLATRRRCPRIVLQFHGGQSDWLVGSGHRLFKALSARMLSLTDAVLVLSSEEQRHFRRFWPQGETYVVSNPFVPRAPFAADLSVAGARRSEEPLTLLFVGRLVREKGIFELLDAVAMLDGRRECRLVIAGDGPARDRVKEHVTELGIGGAVKLAGHLPRKRLWRAYREADALVLPSYKEGFPTVIAEALDAGLPIVTTRLRGMADHLHEGVNALFVEPADAEGLARTLERLLRDRSLRRRMGRANRSKVAEFAPNVVGRQYLDALEAVVNPSSASVARARGTNVRARGIQRRPAPETQKRAGLHVCRGGANEGASDMTTDAVRAFWEEHPCGSDRSSADDRLEYFLQIERARYAEMPYLQKVGAFGAFAGKRVLEIGCGLGTDGVQFARGGAIYTGVDLTEAAVRLARENFELRRLGGKFQVADAENLPFADGEFDHVYSFGVIHHMANPDRAMAEIRRVLRPGGTVTAMLYNSTSVNYVVEIMFLRKVGRVLLSPAWGPRLLSSLLGFDRDKLEGHRSRVSSDGPVSREQWISMNTDGPECPLARVYSAGEAERLFAGFAGFRTEAHHFDRGHWPVVGGLLPDRVAAGIGRLWGWHRMCYAVKPALSSHGFGEIGVQQEEAA